MDDLNQQVNHPRQGQAKESETKNQSSAAAHKPAREDYIDYEEIK